MITKLANKILSGRVEHIAKYTDMAEMLQRRQLIKLLTTGANSEFGKEHHFNELKSPEQFATQVPVCRYEDLHNSIERMIKGEENVLWPGKITYFAQSSGTTDAKSKFIPVSSESFKTMHYQGGIDTVAMYLSMNPESRFFDGKGLILGAGKSNITENGIHLGLLSGLLVEHANPLLNLIRVPQIKTAMITDFSDKVEAMLPEIIHQNIISCSGIPSWYQILFLRVLKETGKTDISEVWPGLELFIHGGVSFEPYKKLFESIVKSPNMHYMEVYNASEGFFAMQNDFSDPSMLLMLDYGTYYEFLPTEEWTKTSPKAIPLWEVEIGKPYAMVISNNSGLWRYNTGDVVTFTNTKPYKFIISGRTKHYLNLCGEELMVGNADAAIAKACEICNATISNYTATVIYATTQNKARHQWLIEFEKQPQDLILFQKILDETLISVNSDYESKRTKDVALTIPEIIVARPGLFLEWLKQKNKTGGQQKIPRLSQKRDFMDELLELNR